MPRSKFLKIECNDCKNEQIIFGNASSEIKCLKCGAVLAKPSANKTKVLTKIKEVFE